MKPCRGGCANLFLSLALMLLLAVREAGANAPGLACQSAIAQAERDQGIPTGLLQAIAVIESGQRSAETGTRLPWPWAVNVAGQGQLAPSLESAVGVVGQALSRGVRSVDIGCLQINLHHHPQAFARWEDGFDPVNNARYGARFLAELRERTGSWNIAVAHYHSATPDRGALYRERVMAQWGGLGGTVPVEPAPRSLAASPAPTLDLTAPLWAASGLGVRVLRPSTTGSGLTSSVPVNRAVAMRVIVPGSSR